MANIIVVDDSAFLVKQIVAFLENHDHNVVATGKNGIEAVELYREHKPDLITLDITMPNKSGADALKDIFQEFPEATALMISALKDKCIIRDCIELGAKGYVEKPLKFKDEEFCVDFLENIEDALEE